MRPGRCRGRTLPSALVGLVALASLLAGCGTATGAAGGSSADGSAGAGAQSRAADARSSDDALASQAPTGEDDAATGAVAPVFEFSGETVDGRAFDGASLAGQPTVLWFWAPWCPTCRGQIEGVSNVAEEFGDRVDVVGVGGLDDGGAIADFADQVSPAVTMLSDAEGAVWRHFAITAQSVYVVLDADGEVLAEGYLEDAALREVVAAATA